MSDPRAIGGTGSRSEGLKQVGAALHDLCQPLTTLQCRLEMASAVGTPEAYREAVDMGLLECARLVEAIGSMREIMRAAMQAAAAKDAGASP